MAKKPIKPLALSKKALYAIAYSLLENSGKIEMSHFSKIGTKTIDEIDDFVLEITGHRLNDKCKHETHCDSLKKQIKDLLF